LRGEGRGEGLSPHGIDSLRAPLIPTFSPQAGRRRSTGCPTAATFAPFTKTADNGFYERIIPIADALYDVYLDEIRKEGLIP
jgi:hypothetical protein